jgi:PadR family transcriptional regulator, regulatory protein PadR
MNIQFKKGVLELCVLTILSNGDRYGYELSSSISENIDISDGTIYPVLRRLKGDGFVTTYLRESNEGPPRKYYKLTDDGGKEKTSLHRQWKTFVSSVENLVEREGIANE